MTKATMPRLVHVHAWGEDHKSNKGLHLHFRRHEPSHSQPMLKIKIRHPRHRTGVHTDAVTISTDLNAKDYFFERLKASSAKSVSNSSVERPLEKFEILLRKALSVPKCKK
jgi:hypothetical protein